jgi:hypothetical protein
MGREEDIQEIARAIRDLPPTPVDDAFSRVAAGEIIGRNGHPREEEPVPGLSVKFDRTMNFGQVIQILAIVSSAAGMLWWFSASQAVLRRDLDDVMRRGVIYAPRVDALAESNKIQDERIGNLTASFADTRRQMGDIQSTLGAIREDMATVRAKLSIDNSRR